MLLLLLLGLVVFDDTGHRVVIEKNQRVISLAPNLTEFLQTLGLEERIIGKTTWSSAPGEIVLTKGMVLLREKVLLLNPDIVFATEINSSQDIAWLRKKKIPVIFFKFTSVSDIPRAMLILGKIFNIEEKAMKESAIFIERLFGNSEKIPNKRKKILFVLDIQGGIWVPGKRTFLDELITLSGGINIAPFEGWKTISPEIVIRENPEFIIAGYEDIKEQITENPAFKSLKAVQENKVITILEPDIFSRPGPNLYKAKNFLIKTLYGN